MVVVMNLDLMEVDVVVMVDTAGIRSVVKVADRDCREKTFNVSSLVSVNRLSTILYGLLIKKFIHLAPVKR